MKLIVDELSTTLDQEFVATRNQVIKYIRPHLYIHNNPSGSLKLSVYDGGMALIQSSNTMSIADIKLDANITQDYFHGYIRFDFDGFGVVEGDEITIRLTASGGYTFSEGNYVGICRDFDLRKYDPTFSPSDGIYSVADYELFESKSKKKGSY